MRFERMLQVLWVRERIRKAVGRILELANKAYSQYVRQSTHEKASLLKILFSNCLMKDGSPCPTYRKPFDLIAESVKPKDWLAFVDDLRIFCLEVSVT